MSIHYNVYSCTFCVMCIHICIDFTVHVHRPWLLQFFCSMQGGLVIFGTIDTAAAVNFESVSGRFDSQNSMLRSADIGSPDSLISLISLARLNSHLVALDVYVTNRQPLLHHRNVPYRSPLLPGSTRTPIGLDKASLLGDKHRSSVQWFLIINHDFPNSTKM